MKGGGCCGWNLKVQVDVVDVVDEEERRKS